MCSINLGHSATWTPIMSTDLSNNSPQAQAQAQAQGPQVNAPQQQAYPPPQGYPPQAYPGYPPQQRYPLQPGAKSGAPPLPYTPQGYPQQPGYTPQTYQKPTETQEGRKCGEICTEIIMVVVTLAVLGWLEYILYRYLI